MANPTWPTGLPSPFAEGEPVYEPYDNWIKSQTETGPGKARRRFTGVTAKLSFTLVLTAAQYTIFWNFFNTTLNEVGQFDWIDLRTGVARTYKFSKRPSETWVGGDPGVGWWRLPILLDMLS